MKTLAILTSCLFVLCACGCEGPVSGPERYRHMNTNIVGTYNDIALENAIIAQHTLYGYHFIDGSAELNQLGNRDLTVLANHSKRSPTELCIQRGTSDELYQERVNSVLDFLRKNSVDTNAITISSRLPGGDGVSAYRAIAILESDAETSEH